MLTNVTGTVEVFSEGDIRVDKISSWDSRVTELLLAFYNLP